jgi:hypothetical protein
MDKRPSETLKTAAAALAEWVHAGRPDTAAPEAFVREWELSNRQRPDLRPAQKQEDEQKTAAVGIWKRSFSSRGIVYEREVKFKRYWHQWANVHKILPKGEKKRIVLMGESVARGFFYDPYYTVAAELENLLNGIDGAPAMQVTDLAKTNCSMGELLGLARSCRALEPDAIVFFAGNNWHTDLYDSFTDEDHREMIMLIERRDFSGLKNRMENKLSAMVRSFFENVNKLLPAGEIPVVFLIPGFNLADWKNDHARRSLPWLQDTDVRVWLGYKAAAQEALISNNGEGLAVAAREMVGLDPYHPFGYELLAHYHLGRGDWNAAKANLLLYRDTVLVNRGDNIHPVCYGIIRETIVSEAKRYGIAVVDCQALYETDKGEGIPGRDYFLDYCHLTAEGIRVTMQETSRVLAGKIMGKEPSIDRLPKQTAGPANQVRAIAHFSAAIHNAHRDQPQEIVEYHCRKALSCSATVEEVMLPFIDFSTRYASSNLCDAFEKVILTGKMQQYDGGFALQHPKGWKLMDIKLVDAITGALNAAGYPTGNKVMKLRMQEHAVGARGINLLESYYSRTSYNCFPGELNGPLFLQARSITSSFSLVTSGAYLLHLELVYRTPCTDEAADCVSIVINDRQDKLIRLPVTGKWNAVNFDIGQDTLINGINRLTIAWPFGGTCVPSADGDDPSKAVLQALSPVLGEIHSFSAVERNAL